MNAVSLDYSLLIQTGLERTCNAATLREKPFDVLDVPTICLPSSWVAKPMLATKSDQASQRQKLENIDWDSLEQPIR